MAYREKGIPPERRLNIRGKMGRAVLAVTAVAAAVFWLSGSGAAMAAQEPQEEGYGAELRITRDVTIPGQDVSRRLERKMVYTGVEGAEEIPGSISLKEDVSGSQAEGTLFLRKSRIVREEWQDGFTAPVTFHAYGADEYRRLVWGVIRG